MARESDITFSVGIDEAELKALEKRLEKVTDVLQKALTIKNEPLTPTLKGIGVEAQKSVAEPLLSLQYPHLRNSDKIVCAATMLDTLSYTQKKQVYCLQL